MISYFRRTFMNKSICIAIYKVVKFALASIDLCKKLKYSNVACTLHTIELYSSKKIS